MISSFFLKSFKSFSEAEMAFAPLTLLIGPNASGKSNLLEAIRILAWLAKGGRVDDFEKSVFVPGSEGLVRGNASDLFRTEENIFELGCKIDGTEGWNRLSLQIQLFRENLVIRNEMITNDNGQFLYRIENDDAASFTDEIKITYNNFKEGDKPRIPCSNRQAVFYQLETPGRFNSEDERSQKVIPSAAKAFRENLRNIIFLDPQPAAMRDYSYATKDDTMQEDGGNLSSILYKICKAGAKQKTKLLNFIRSLPEQDITDIDFSRTDRNDVMVRLKESFGNRERTMDAPLLSDGTLRVLAVGATLLSAAEGSMVIIEEIDNGVHPSRAEGLIRQIRDITRERNLRVLLSSHNPALLDALPDEALGDVLCCYRNPEAGDSRVIRLGDLERYPELIAQGSLGYLMTRQVLDRFLKDKTTGAERKQAALEWLKELKKEVSE